MSRPQAPADADSHVTRFPKTYDVWTAIDDGVTTSITAIRVAQNVFLASLLPNTTSVPADIFDFRNMSIAKGEMLPFAELAVEFR